MNIPVYYTSKMIADSGCFSPSAAKPAKVVQSWQEKFGDHIDIIDPDPVTSDQFSLAHDPTFVSDVLECRIVNGFGNKSPEVAASLRYTSGAMLSAARHALKSRMFVAAPCSGFHHAGWESSEGYCTFNGLMVAALALKQEKLVNRVGILDLDMHYGNGTDNIINKTQSRSWVKHYTGGAEFEYSHQAKHFLDKRLPEVLQQMSDCCLVLYQAGADPHINDPFGGWLTTEQLAIRDQMVFEFFHEKRIPVAWNLAGGYQVEPDGSIPKVLEIHDNTMRACIEASK